MSNMRPMLIIGLIIVLMLMYQAWQQDYGPKPQTSPSQSTESNLTTPGSDTVSSDVPGVSNSSTGSIDDDVPDAPRITSDSQGQAVSAVDAAVSASTITVTTDVLSLEISTRGGEIRHSKLLEYPIDRKIPEDKYVLQHDQGRDYHVIQSGLVSATHEGAFHTRTFTSGSSSYDMGGAETLNVPLTWRSEDGTTVTKTYTFTRGSYQVRLNQAVTNNSDATWQGAAYHRLERREPILDDKSAFTNPERFSFNGLAIYTSADKYEKFDYEDIREGSVERQSEQAWMAMVQHYFITAWLPEAGTNSRYIAKTVADPAGTRYRLEQVQNVNTSIAPGDTGNFAMDLYMGPKLQDVIDTIRPGLDLTVDYGIFTPLSAILFWILKTLYSFLGNWGWSIVVLTIIIKAMFFKLTEKQYKTTAKLRKLTPRIQALKERYGDDKQTFNMKMMELYKTEKANPFGGCLPMLIQIPVFIALYWVLIESVELRQAPWMLWIQDLTAPDPYFILPVIYGAGMILTMRLSPAPGADPIQQKIMMFMPVAFTLLFLFFQSGLVLYWAVNVIISLAQQWIITKRIDAQG